MVFEFTVHQNLESSTYVSRLTLMVQQSSSSDWSMNWKTPEVRVDHWIANEARRRLNDMLPNP